MPVSLYQSKTLTGSFTDKQHVNDGNGATIALATTGQSVDVDLGDIFIINQFRHYGHTDNTGNGTWTLQYKLKATDSYIEWKTFPVRVSGDWSDWFTMPLILAQYIRLTCTLQDAHNWSSIGELEIKG